MNDFTDKQKEWLSDYVKYDSAWLSLKINRSNNEEAKRAIDIIKKFSEKYFNKK